MIEHQQVPLNYKEFIRTEPESDYNWFEYFGKRLTNETDEEIINNGLNKLLTEYSSQLYNDAQICIYSTDDKYCSKLISLYRPNENSILPWEYVVRIYDTEFLDLIQFNNKFPLYIAQQGKSYRYLVKEITKLYERLKFIKDGNSKVDIKCMLDIKQYEQYNKFMYYQYDDNYVRDDLLDTFTGFNRFTCSGMSYKIHIDNPIGIFK